MAQEKLKRERPFWSSHVVAGGRDALKSKNEIDPLYSGDALKRYMCERSSGPGHVEDGVGDAHEHTFDVRQRHADQWLIRLQRRVTFRDQEKTTP
jgi:hypothetical protein